MITLKKKEMKIIIDANIYKEIRQRTKAESAEILVVLLNNAIEYMKENGMSDKEIANYLGTTRKCIEAVNNEDFYSIVINYCNLKKRSDLYE